MANTPARASPARQAPRGGEPALAIRFPDAGTYRVFCGIHPTMELAVTVE